MVSKWYQDFKTMTYSKRQLESTFKTGKAKIGDCILEKYRTSIRLRFIIPQSYFTSKLSSNQRSQTITIGNYTIDVWKIAIEKCLEITSDIANNTFDLTLIKYDEKRKIIPEILPENNINDIRYHWERYKQHKLKENEIFGNNRKKGQGVAQNTIKTNWKDTDLYLSNLPEELYLIANAQQFLHYLRTKYTDYTIRIPLAYLCSALNLSIKFGDYSGINPYSRLKQQLILNKSDNNDYYFSTSEMEIIINAFTENRFRELQQSQNYSHHYTDLIKFRFLTGLRISESIALT